MISRPDGRGRPARASEHVTYWTPRARRRWPVVLTGVGVLALLVTGQVAVGAGPAVPPQVAAPAPQTPSSAPAPSAPSPSAPVPSVASSAGPGPATTGPAPTAAATVVVQAESTGVPIRPAGPPPVDAAVPGPVDEVRVEFGAGAVLDEAALAALEPVVSSLVVPGAPPALVQGFAEPGPDEAAATSLARERAAVVAAALVSRGVPEQLLRQRAAVDGDRGRVVVIATDLP